MDECAFHPLDVVKLRCKLDIFKWKHQKKSERFSGAHIFCCQALFIAKQSILCETLHSLGLWAHHLLCSSTVLGVGYVHFSSAGPQYGHCSSSDKWDKKRWQIATQRLWQPSCSGLTHSIVVPAQLAVHPGLKESLGMVMFVSWLGSWFSTWVYELPNWRHSHCSVL